MPNIMILAQELSRYFYSMSLMAKMLKSEKGHTSVNYPGHLHYVPKQYAWYHDSSSSDSPDMSRLMTKPTKWHVLPAKTDYTRLGFIALVHEQVLLTQQTLLTPPSRADLSAVLYIDWYSHPIPIYRSVQANENGPILDREISRDFIIHS